MIRPAFQEDEVTIYCGPAEEFLASLPRNHFAVLVVDPPYTPPSARLSLLWGAWMRVGAKALILGPKQYRIVPSQEGWTGCEELGVESAFGHPVARGVLILRDLLALCPPGPVLDPYMGSGSSLVAARMLGREYCGIEIEAKWCQTAWERKAAMAVGA